MKIILLIAGLGLSGCSTFVGRCSSVPIAPYTDDFEAKLSGEIAAAPRTSVWPEAIIDYRSMRDSIRACRNKTIG